MNGEVCVCVPARNEARHIATLLGALAAQTVARPFRVALCINNSDDDTGEQAREAVARASDTLSLKIIECRFEPALAHAGFARRAAMDLGADLLENDEGLLISTDADCRPPPDWIASNLAFAAPDRIVGGRIELDKMEAPHAPDLFALRRRFDAYWRAVRAIEDDIDPVSWDPAPRHGDHTGASLAVPVGLYRRAGGVPLLPSGEDRAFVDAAVAAGGTLVHPQTVWTRASSRIVGRAEGGMACDLQGWIDAMARGETPRVPSFSQWEARARWRRDQRQRGGAADLIAAERRLPAMPSDMALPEAPGA